MYVTFLFEKNINTSVYAPLYYIFYRYKLFHNCYFISQIPILFSKKIMYTL